MKLNRFAQIIFILSFFVSCVEQRVKDTPIVIDSELIHGEDNREKTNSLLEDKKLQTVGLLKISNRGDKTFNSCSATVIGDEYLITAAHCVWDSENEKIFDHIEFFPGKHRKENSFSRIFIKRGWILKDYVSGFNRMKERGQSFDSRVITQEMIESDIALLQANYTHNFSGVGEINGKVPFKSYQNDIENKKVKMISYPGDKESGTQWSEDCEVAYNKDRELTTSCDTYAGASGAALMMYSDKFNKYYVQGILSAENFEEKTNFVTEITRAIYRDINRIIFGRLESVELFEEFRVKTVGKHYVSFLNECEEEVYIGLHYKDFKDKWVTKGFFTIKNLESKELLKTQGRQFYYTVFSKNRGVWRGNSKNITLFNKKYRTSKHKLGNNFGDRTIELRCE